MVLKRFIYKKNAFFPHVLINIFSPSLKIIFMIFFFLVLLKNTKKKKIIEFCCTLFHIYYKKDST